MKATIKNKRTNQILSTSYDIKVSKDSISVEFGLIAEDLQDIKDKDEFVIEITDLTTRFNNVTV